VMPRNVDPPSRIEDLASALNKLAIMRKRLEEEWEATYTAFMEAAEGRSSVSFYDSEDKETVVTATIVRGTRITIDPDRLKRELGASMWGKVTRPQLDKELLEARIAVGEVDPTVVGTCSQEAPVKPYVRFSARKGVIKPQARVRGHRQPSEASPRRIRKKEK
jgi:hypothetical protein